MIKNPNILILLVFMTSMTFTSCVEEYEIEDKNFESKLVIGALFDNESPWSVKVTSSSDAFDEESINENITFATVKIYDQDGGYLYDLYHQVDGIYANGDYGPSPKRGYSIKVSATGYHAVTAKSFAPEKATLEIKDVIYANGKENDFEVDFEIEDKSMLESYYVWEVVSLEDDSTGNTSSSSSQLSATWFNELANTDREFLEGGSFGDGTYQGTYSSYEGNRRMGFIANVKNNKNNKDNKDDKHTSSIGHSVEHIVFGDIDPPSGHANEIVTYVDPKEDNPNQDDEEGSKGTFTHELRVMSISKELYKFHKSLRENQILYGEGVHSNQAAPTVFTNVSNGLGIFAGFSESVIQFSK